MIKELCTYVFLTFLPFLSSGASTASSILLNGNDPIAFYRCDGDTLTEAYTDDPLTTKPSKVPCSSLKKIEYYNSINEDHTYVYVWEMKKNRTDNFLLVLDKKNIKYWIKEKNENDEADPAESIEDFLNNAQNRQLALAPNWNKKIYKKPLDPKFTIKDYRSTTVSDVKQIGGKLWLQVHFYDIDIFDSDDPKHPVKYPKANICKTYESNASFNGWIPLHDQNGNSNIQLDPCF